MYDDAEMLNILTNSNISVIWNEMRSTPMLWMPEIICDTCIHPPFYRFQQECQAKIENYVGLELSIIQLDPAKLEKDVYEPQYGDKVARRIKRICKESVKNFKKEGK